MITFGADLRSVGQDLSVVPTFIFSHIGLPDTIHVKDTLPQYLPKEHCKGTSVCFSKGWGPELGQGTEPDCTLCCCACAFYCTDWLMLASDHSDWGHEKWEISGNKYTFKEDPHNLIQTRMAGSLVFSMLSINKPELCPISWHIQIWRVQTGCCAEKQHNSQQSMKSGNWGYHNDYILVCSLLCFTDSSPQHFVCFSHMAGTTPTQVYSLQVRVDSTTSTHTC